MTSRAQQFFNIFARYVQKPTLANVAHQPSLGKIFELTAEVTTRALPRTNQKFRNEGSLRIRRMIPSGDTPNMLLYFHGGGFTIGSSGTHRWLAARLAAQINAEAWLPDYRLAPAHPYPAAPDDCLTAYQSALKEYPPERITLAGDSAGGALVLNTLTRATNAGLQMPSAIALLSPVSDLSASNHSREAFRHSDMLLPDKWVKRAIKAYLAGHDPTDPAASPQFADLSQMPPAFVQAAEGEMLIDDAKFLADHLPQATLDLWEDVPHVWQLDAGWTREADDALRRIAQFLNTHLP